jgi:hypothetical protein
VRLAEDNLGLPDVTRLTERGPLQNGDTDIGFRLEPRIIQVVVGVFTEDGDPIVYWNLRRTLQRMLMPTSTPLRLRYTLPTGEVRQIDVTYAGGLTWPSDERMLSAHRTAFALRAADPTFYDPDGISVVYEVGGGAGAWTIPWEIPWGIGSATVNSTQAVGNPGDWEAYPTITVVGPITNLIIRNTTINEKLDFTGYAIASGTTITIDTRYGVKTIVDQNGTSQIDKLSNDSDLATWRIAAHPEAPDGTNSIQVTGTNATSVTAIFLQFKPRYIAL